MSSFLKDLASVTLSKGGVVLFSLAQSIIIARLLGPELNGLIATLIVYPSLFMVVGSLGVRQSTAYYIAKGIYEEEKIKTAVSQIWIISSILSVVASFVLIIFFSNSGDNLLLVILAISPIPFALFNTYNSGVYLGKNSIQAFNKVNWLPPFFVLLATLLLVVLLNLSVVGAMIAMIFGPLAMSIIMLTINDFYKAFSFKIDIKIVKSLLSLGIVYAIALVIINLNYRLDVILIDKLSTKYETGIYSKGAGIVEYLWEIPMLLSTIIFARSANASDSLIFSKKVCQLLRLSLIIISVCCIILAYFAPFIFKILFGNEFLPSSEVMRILIPGVILLTVFKVLNMDMAGRGKPWISLKAMLPALVLNVILNFIWIPEHGANGASLASTVSYSLAAFIFLFVYSNEAKISIREILTYKKNDFLTLRNMTNNFLSKIQNKP